jgi:hypothetical protein
MAVINHITITVIGPITIVDMGMTLKDWASVYPPSSNLPPTLAAFYFYCAKDGTEEWIGSNCDLLNENGRE